MTPEYRIDAENRITSYLNHNNVKNIKYMQVEQTYRDLGVEVNVWNVKAETGNWWVVEGEDAPMIYPQEEFYFSADEAYSFHMGITQRLHARHHKEFKHIIDELPLDINGIKSISRRLNLAAGDLNNIAGAEDIQSIGLTCRESLIELAGTLVDANPDILEENNLKAADFKGIAKVVITIYTKGKRNDICENTAVIWQKWLGTTHLKSCIRPTGIFRMQRFACYLLAQLFQYSRISI